MIPLFKPYMPKQLPEMEDILQSGQLAFGKWGREFERKLREYIGVENLITTCNFSTAIQIAMTVLGFEPDDQVIASPMSCLNSTMPLRALGLKVVWADIDPRTGTLSPESVEEHITNKTRLIFHNHYCGYIGYVDEINAIGKNMGYLFWMIVWKHLEASTKTMLLETSEQIFQFSRFRACGCLIL